MTAKRFLLSFIACCCIQQVHASGQDLLKQCMEHLRIISTQCSMDYTAVYNYPDGEKLSVAGKMAVDGRCYYDSSALRFVFINKDWMIAADHRDKEISACYIPKVEQALGDKISIRRQDFLASSKEFLNYNTIQSQKVGDSTLMVTLTYAAANSMLRNVSFWYQPGTGRLFRYKGTVLYPYSTDNDPGYSKPTFVRLEFDCYNVAPLNDKRIFDASRLISFTKGKAVLKRYNQYKTFRF